MIGLLPLIAMWLFANRPSAPPAPSRGGAPKWPTPASPPPMPAFRGKRSAPSADPSKSSTSLADLHNNPPKLVPASASEPAALKRAAKSAFAARATSLLRQRTGPGPDATVPVAKLQQILISRGIKVAPDGLYGPRTAKGWQTLAKSKGLPAGIKRVGPKIANVATHAYDSLAVPPIP